MELFYFSYNVNGAKFHYCSEGSIHAVSVSIQTPGLVETTTQSKDTLPLNIHFISFFLTLLLTVYSLKVSMSAYFA